MLKLIIWVAVNGTQVVLITVLHEPLALIDDLSYSKTD